MDESCSESGVAGAMGVRTGLGEIDTGWCGGVRGAVCDMLVVGGVDSDTGGALLVRFKAIRFAGEE